MDTMNMDMDINRNNDPDYHFKKETKITEPQRHFHTNDGPSFIREDRSDNIETSQAWISEPPNQMFEEANMDSRDRLYSNADSLLDQSDYQQLREQEQAWNQKPVTAPCYTVNETTPLLHPMEEKTYVSDDQLPPRMAEFDMDARQSTQQEQQQQQEAQPQRTQPLRARPLMHYMRDLFMWRNMKDSAVIFSAGLALMFALSYFSFITIFAYLSLAILMIAGGIVFGRQLMFALQQRQGPHPFQRALERDIVIDPEYVHEQLDGLLYSLNQQLVRMRNLFLADSLAETLKMALYMYLLTYVGRWFNLMTLMMMAWVGAFIVPKLYMMYRPQIDGILHHVRVRVDRMSAGIRAKVEQQRQHLRNRRNLNMNNHAAEVQKTIKIKKVEKVQ